MKVIASCDCGARKTFRRWFCWQRANRWFEQHAELHR